MQFVHEIVIAKIRDEVWALFDNFDNMKHWQPTLQSFTPVSGTPGQPGAVTKLVYLENGRTIELIETITERKQPDSFSGTYSNEMVTNTIKNTFSEAGPGSTRWVMECEFELKGFLKLIGFMMKGAFKKRVQEDCERFKKFAESC
jgi:uncharacterized membrane protein